MDTGYPMMITMHSASRGGLPLPPGPAQKYPPQFCRVVQGRVVASDLEKSTWERSAVFVWRFRVAFSWVFVSRGAHAHAREILGILGVLVRSYIGSWVYLGGILDTFDPLLASLGAWGASWGRLGGLFGVIGAP